MTGFRWTIKRKLLALGAGTVVPLLLLIAYWARWEVSEHIESAEAELALASRQAAGQIEAVLERVTGHLDVLARDPAVQRRQVEQMERRFREVRAGYPDLENVFAVGTDGRVFATAVLPSTGAPVTAADRPWLQQVMTTGRPAVGGFQVGRITGQPVVVVAVPLRAGDGSPAGAIGAALSLRVFHLFFEPLPFAHGRTVTVVDREGQVLTHVPKSGEWIGRRLPSAASLPAGPAVVRKLAWFEGGEQIVGVTPVAAAGWRVLAGRSRAASEALLWREATLIALPALGLLALSTLVALLITRRIWRPIQALAEAAARVPRGEHVAIRVDSTDEVGGLAQAFNTMAAEIRDGLATRTRAEEQLRERHTQLQALYDVQDAVSQAETLEEILEAALSALERAVAPDRSAVLLSGPDGVVHFRAWRGLSDAYRTAVDGHSLWRADDQNPRPILVSDAEAEPTLEALGPVIVREGIRALGFIPLLHQGRLLGKFMVYFNTPHSFEEAEVRMLQAIARHVAFAIGRRRAEEQLRQSEKLATMGELLAGVAHELNNPLAVVVGYASLFSDAIADGPVANRAAKLAEAAARCARVVKNFLALARQYPPERQEVRLNQVAEETVELLAYPLRVDDVEVRLDLGENLPILWADAHQLQQVLVNLITNAHHAMRGTPPPRRLTLATRTDPAQARVTVEVADTGPGIPPEIRGRIFEPFFTTKPPGQGTGLGLSICQGIIENHGGSIRVESEPGQGATFVVELPIESPSAAGSSASTAEALPLVRGQTVLVVDDEPEVAAVLSEMLSLDAHQVDVAANGDEALARLQERAYDVILTDVRMPKLDGPGFYREVERRYPHLIRRFAFLTGDMLSLDTRDFLKRTRAPHLSKPFVLNEVRQVVRKLLKGRVE